MENLGGRGTTDMSNDGGDVRTVLLKSQLSGSNNILFLFLCLCGLPGRILDGNPNTVLFPLGTAAPLSSKSLYDIGRQSRLISLNTRGPLSRGHGKR